MTTGPMTTEPASSGPMPSTDPGTSTSTSTTEPLTGGPSSTVTTDITTSGDPAGTTGERLDLPPAPPDANLVGCTLDAPPGTAITGSTVLGPFEADRAYFGGLHADGDLVMPTFMFLSPGALADVELWQQLGTTGEIIHGVALTQPFNAWVGDWTLDSDIITGNSVDPVASQLEITGFAGNWSVTDPSDPPRLLGTLTGDVAGTFDAVFCDHLNIILPHDGRHELGRRASSLRERTCAKGHAPSVSRMMARAPACRAASARPQRRAGPGGLSSFVEWVLRTAVLEQARGQLVAITAETA
ncbi:hypothetical protein [Nannocystis pusilla]|uniref:hypothetical protein n=1 Tax=Nannocystis pusilla TaxID=889268 RepID=UPI003B7A0FF5